jgi:hypothetical protein
MINTARIRAAAPVGRSAARALIISKFPFMIDPHSEDFGTSPNDSAAFGNAPHGAETFRKLQNASERKPSHTLTVREVARIFEAAGVGRTERSITNWCQPNKVGVPRLDSYFDPNERKYFINPESVEIAIQEEQSKERSKSSSTAPFRATDGEHLPNGSAAGEKHDTKEVDFLREEMMDLKITNKAKDMFIRQLQQEREHFEEERKEYVETLMKFNRRVGQLETRLGVEAPTQGFENVQEAEESNGFTNPG